MNQQIQQSKFFASKYFRSPDVSIGKKGARDEIEEEYNEDFDAAGQSMNNHLEKPIDLGKVAMSRKNNESVVEEEIVTEHDKSNITAPFSEIPTQSQANAGVKNTFAKPTFMMKKKF